VTGRRGLLSSSAQSLGPAAGPVSRVSARLGGARWPLPPHPSRSPRSSPPSPTRRPGPPRPPRRRSASLDVPGREDRARRVARGRRGAGAARGGRAASPGYRGHREQGAPGDRGLNGLCQRRGGRQRWNQHPARPVGDRASQVCSDHAP